MTTADKGITSRFLSALTGAVRRTLQSKAADSVNIKDFGAVCDGTTDDTAAWVAAIAACSSNTQSQSKTIRFNGSSKITSPLTISKQYVQIEGESPYASKILFNGVAGGCIKLGGQTYLRAVMRNFGIEGDASSGIGLDLSGITSQVYSSVFENLFIKSGGTAFYAPGGATSPEFFNNVVRLVHAYSYNGHAFHVANGPGVTYESCYAVEVPAGKAGYRMAGIINLISCNGLNEGDVWGAFGSETTGSDGFQGDFGYLDYPVLNMIGCNVERFGSRTTNGIGIRICNNYRTVNIIGGAIQREDSDIPLGVGSYKAVISCKAGPNQSGNPIKFGPGALYLRDAITGIPGYNNTPSQDHFYFESGGHIEDTSLIAEASNIKTYKVQADALSYPTTRSKLINDIYGGYAQEFRAISPRRLSVQTSRYATGAVITPVGSNQAIDVTGRSKVIVTPAAAASISTATFTTTPADPVGDYGRNGELLIEAGNTNLTIKHSASGANTFNLSAGADLTLSAGDVVQFLRSEAGGNWRQVGGSGISQTITNADISSVVIETPTTIASAFFPTASHYGQKIGGIVSGFGLMQIQGAGAAGSLGSWSVAAPFATGWSAGWSDVAVGFWSAEDGSIYGQIVKQAGVTDKLLFFCTTNAALIAAVKTCRFNYMYRAF